MIGVRLSIKFHSKFTPLVSSHLKSSVAFVFLAGPPPTTRNNNVINTSSGFKRQNTVDPATIKENTTRYSGMPPSSRPSTANAPSSKGVISPGSTHTPTPETSKWSSCELINFSNLILIHTTLKLE